MLNKRYYFDIGGTPIDPAVQKEMLKISKDNFANPEALHEAGQQAFITLQKARERLANLINASNPSEIIFTAGATESDNLAIKGVALAHYRQTKGKLTKPILLLSPIEHPAVRQSAMSLECFGFKVQFLPIKQNGQIKLDSLEQMLNEQVLLVSVMAGNNQFGTIQDLNSIGKICRKHQVLFHTDASVFFGIYPLDVEASKLDLATLSSAKIYGPKGVAALYCRQGILIEPLLHGGHQEFGKRAGTHNLPVIAGFVLAAELSLKNRQERLKHDSELSAYFIKKVQQQIPQVVVNGDLDNHLVSNVHLSILGAEGEALVLGLAEYGIAATTGSACSSKSLQADPALKALGLTPELVHGSLRFFWHSWHQQADLDYLIAKLTLVVKRLRKISAYQLGK